MDLRIRGLESPVTSPAEGAQPPLMLSDLDRVGRLSQALRLFSAIQRDASRAKAQRIRTVSASRRKSHRRPRRRGPIPSLLFAQARAWWPLLVLAQFLLLSGCDGAGSDRVRVRLATTTSTENSGLMDHLRPTLEATANVELVVITAGTGQSLELGRRGDVDLVLVHARDREDRFMENGHGLLRRDIMWNDFVIVGPESDPAGIRGLTSAVEAFQKIAATGSAFVSRGDDSGTHIRERATWEEAGISPGGPWHLSAGLGMGKCLIIADEKGAYALTDRGTWISFLDRLSLSILVEGDPSLRNPYGAMLVHPDRHPHVEATGAQRVLDYLTSPEGQQQIAEFRIDGKALFYPAGSK